MQSISQQTHAPQSSSEKLQEVKDYINHILGRISLINKKIDSYSFSQSNILDMQLALNSMRESLNVISNILPQQISKYTDDKKFVEGLLSVMQNLGKFIENKQLASMSQPAIIKMGSILLNFETEFNKSPWHNPVYGRPAQRPNLDKLNEILQSAQTPQLTQVRTRIKKVLNGIQGIKVWIDQNCHFSLSERDRFEINNYLGTILRTNLDLTTYLPKLIDVPTQDFLHVMQALSKFINEQPIESMNLKAAKNMLNTLLKFKNEFDASGWATVRTPNLETLSNILPQATNNNPQMPGSSSSRPKTTTQSTTLQPEPVFQFVSKNGDEIKSLIKNILFNIQEVNSSQLNRFKSASIFWLSKAQKMGVNQALEAIQSDLTQLIELLNNISQQSADMPFAQNLLAVMQKLRDFISNKTAKSMSLKDIRKMTKTLLDFKNEFDASGWVTVRTPNLVELINTFSQVTSNNLQISENKHLGSNTPTQSTPLQQGPVSQHNVGQPTVSNSSMLEGSSFLFFNETYIPSPQSQTSTKPIPTPNRCPTVSL